MIHVARRAPRRSALSIAKPFALATALSLGGALSGCGTEDKVTTGFEPPAAVTLDPRAWSVVVEGCVLDSWQRSTLTVGAGARVIGDVILLCARADAQGAIVPAGADARASLQREVEALRAAGHRVLIGITLADQIGGRYPAVAASAMLADPAWRTAVVTHALEIAQLGDGLAAAMPELIREAREPLTAFMSELGLALRPAKQLDVFALPSTAAPSDLPGGDAYDLGAIAGSVDRVRLMTLDFSCCEGAGPTIDPGWAVDAWRLARRAAPSSQLDVAYPLYGTDFGNAGQRPVTYLEARALATYHRAPLERGPTLAPHLAYVDVQGEPHQLWFDDATSTLAGLTAWQPPVLPSEAGVLFYGLGAEDPALWDALARSVR